MAKLKNNRHEEFCRWYITKINGKMNNATGSAIKAGYSPHTARGQGCRLLTYANIKKRIEELQKARLKRADLSADYITSHLMRIVEDDILNYVEVKETKRGTSVKVKDLDNIDTWNIQEIGINNNGGLKLKTHDKLKALSELANMLKDSKDDKANETDKVIDNFSPVLNMIQKALEGDRDE